MESFLTASRRGLWLIGSLSLATNLLLLALPVYSLQIFDRVLLSRSGDTLWILTLGVAVALASATIVEALRGQLLLRLSNRLAVALEKPLFDATLQRAVGQTEKSLQLMRDLNAMRGFISAPQGLVALIDAPLIPVYLLVVYAMHSWLGHAMMIGAIALMAIAWANEKATASLTRRSLENVQDAHRTLEGILASGDMVAAHGIARNVFDLWRTKQHQALAATSMAGTTGGEFAAAAKGVRLQVNVALTGLGAYLAIHDELTLGAMIAANMLTARALAPMELLIGATRQLIAVKLSWQRLRAATQAEEAGQITRLPPCQGDVEFERVIYMPPGTNQPTIKGLTFKIEAGTFLGLIGPSAAGKSTLARLLCGVWEPKSGVVRIDGADILTWHREDLGRACGYLPQDVQLLDGTVRQNIARFMEAGDEAIIAAAQAAGAHDLIVRLPKGYETRVGTAGTWLSAGQRQRIGLARALFGDPRLIVLDEPNSNLDTEGEQALEESLARARSRGATLVVISHRPAVLALADVLAVLVDGQLQQIGSRQDVLKRVQPSAIHSAPLHVA